MRRPKAKAKAVVVRKRRPRGSRGLGASPLENESIAYEYAHAALKASTCAEAWPLVEAGRPHYLANPNPAERSYGDGDRTDWFESAVRHVLDLCKRKQ
jgi:hypothetical protein